MNLNQLKWNLKKEIDTLPLRADERLALQAKLEKRIDDFIDSIITQMNK